MDTYVYYIFALRINTHLHIECASFISKTSSVHDTITIFTNMTFEQEINIIRDKIVNRTILLSFIFSLIAIVPSFLRVYNYGVYPAMYFQLLAMLVILTLVVFKKRISLKFKLHVFLLIFTIIPLAGVWDFRMAGGSYIFMVALILACLTYGLRTGFYYAAMYLFIYALIGNLHILGLAPKTLNFNEYTNDEMTWISSFSGLLFTLVISLDTSSVFYDLFINKLKSSLNFNRRYLEKNQELQTSERKYRSLFNGSTDGIILLDKDQKIVDCNPSFLEMIEQEFENVKGIRFSLYAIDSKLEDQISDRFSNKKDKIERLDHQLVEIKNSKGEYIPIRYSTYEFNEDDELFQWVVVHDLRRIKSLEKAAFANLIKGEEKERERFSKELHDGIGPILSASSLYLSAMAEETDLKKIQLYSDKLRLAIDEAIMTTKEISKNLSPAVIRKFGVVKGLEAFIDKIRDTTNIQFELNDPDSFKTNNKIQRITIYRTLTELINNSIKHSDAQQIIISIQVTENMITIEYNEDGKGFEYETVIANSQDLGIFNLKSRVEKLGGQMNYETSPGNGVYVSITLPKI